MRRKRGRPRGRCGARGKRGQEEGWPPTCCEGSVAEVSKYGLAAGTKRKGAIGNDNSEIRVLTINPEYSELVFVAWPAAVHAAILRRELGR